jgi:uncharacterized membrane protein
MAHESMRPTPLRAVRPGQRPDPSPWEAPAPWPAVRPLVTAGVVLGAGLGGFVDGILFHQILQLHSMLSAWLPRTTLAAVEVNMFWDGLFHALTWLTTVIGLALLFRAARRPAVRWSARILVGGMLAGWGLFNVVEGLIDHYGLQVHHVVETAGLSPWDAAFLGAGALLVVLGIALARNGAGRSQWAGR